VRNWLVMMKIAFEWPPFSNGRRQNRQNFNVLWFQWTLISRVILKCRKLLMVSDFNAHWYLWVFWSEELVGNDAICIQGHFYEATNFKMAANKIVKLSTVSDFNENWYLGVFWSEELVGNGETCIHMPKLWYGGRLGTSVFASKHN
jgi:hypothetical protein